MVRAGRDRPTEKVTSRVQNVSIFEGVIVIAIRRRNRYHAGIQ
jgi:hypothetical protein